MRTISAMHCDVDIATSLLAIDGAAKGDQKWSCDDDCHCDVDDAVGYFTYLPPQNFMYPLSSFLVNINYQDNTILHHNNVGHLGPGLPGISHIHQDLHCQQNTIFYDDNVGHLGPGRPYPQCQHDDVCINQHCQHVLTIVNMSISIVTMILVTLALASLAASASAAIALISWAGTLTSFTWWSWF